MVVKYLVFVCCVQGSSGRDLQLTGHVGFDSLPDQLVNKCVSKGFDFNILCIGTPRATTVFAPDCVLLAV